MEKILEKYIDEFRAELDEIKSDYYKFEFNTSQLPDTVEYTYPNKDIQTHRVFQEMFNSLENFKTNCLYWFSVKSLTKQKY